jgi:hypothetical protein
MREIKSYLIVLNSRVWIILQAFMQYSSRHDTGIEDQSALVYDAGEIDATNRAGTTYNIGEMSRVVLTCNHITLEIFY